MSSIRKLIIGFAAGCASTGAANAQSLTGNVGSADITSGDRGAEIRFGSDEDGSAAVRLHYDHAFSDWYQLRAVAAFNKKEEQSWDYSALTFENWLQWSEESSGGEGFNGGARFAYTLSDGDRPDKIAGRLTLTDKFATNWEWRANMIAAAEVGDAAKGGADFESRLQLSRALPVTFASATSLRFGAELFSEYGNSEDIPAFEDQAHQAGPVIKAKWKNGFYLQAAARAGLTSGSDDAMAKLFIGREF